MKQYYELYTIENSLERMEKLLRTIAEDEDKPGVYEKTKRRYDRIEDSLETCLKYVKEIKLHYAIQSKNPDDSFEPDYSDPRSRSRVSNELENRLRRIESRVFTSEDDEYYPELDLNGFDDDTDDSCDEFYNQTFNYAEVRDATIEAFDKIFESVASMNYEDISADPNMISSVSYMHPLSCAELIYRWFHTRFVVHGKDLDFQIDRYVKAIPKVVKGIILGYTHWATTGGDYLAFRNQILNWCYQLEESGSCKWGCPAIITYYYKLPLVRSFSLEATAIYETLLRLGYKSLSKSELIHLPELESKNILHPLFELSSDLIVTSEILHNSEYEEILLHRSSLNGYSVLMEMSNMFSKSSFSDE